MKESVNRVRHVLTEMIKAAVVSNDKESLAFRDSARHAQKALADHPPDPDSVKIDGAWTLAIQDAEAPEFHSKVARVSLTLQRESPFTFSEILQLGFDVDEGVKRICNSASTG